ncbi:hypothetical protein ABH945_001082 [Paraburkholderia sp. GAS333]|uniref:hypothetical protein n=1 Tax=Paraburkholderia sp. GAS333 TaxID=3156279 RepID=UPI003D20306E
MFFARCEATLYAATAQHCRCLIQVMNQLSILQAKAIKDRRALFVFGDETPFKRELPMCRNPAHSHVIDTRRMQSGEHWHRAL